MSLNGFIVDIRTVSESNLELEVDASRIPWEEYRKLVDELGDVLSDIDEKWSARSWLVRGKLNRMIFQGSLEKTPGMISDTTIKGRYSLRACNVNHRTKNEDFDWLVTEIKRLGEKLLPEVMGKK